VYNVGQVVPNIYQIELYFTREQLYWNIIEMTQRSLKCEL